MKKALLVGLAWCFAISSWAQQTFPNDGLEVRGKTQTAIYASEIWVSPDKKMKDATLIIQEGEIVGVKAGKQQPQGAEFIDYDGLSIYPSFIDLNGAYGIKTKKLAKQPSGPHYSSSKKGPFYWNDAISPENHAFELFAHDAKQEKSYLQAGFGAVVAHNEDGFVRGTGILVSPGIKEASKAVILEKSSAHYSFSKGSSQMSYPSSLMGAIALMRQYFSDAQWYSNENNRDHANLSLQAELDNASLPKIMNAGDALDVLRAKKLFQESGQKAIYVAGNDVYKELNQFQNTGVNLVVSIDFPKPIALNNAFEVNYTSLEKMKHWEWAPKGPALLHEKGISTALTMAGHKSAKEFLSHLQKAVKYGWPEKEALRALTTNPSKWVKATAKVGTLEKGKLANFIVTQGSPFKKGSILENWVQGEKKVVGELPETDLSGNYRLALGNNLLDTLKIAYKDGKNSAKLEVDTLKQKVKLKWEDEMLNLHLFSGTDSSTVATLYANGNQSWKGNVAWNGTLAQVKLLYLSGNKSKDKEDEKAKEITEPTNYTYPLKAFGYNEIPKAESVIIKNATVWTNEEAGIVTETDVWVSNGKIIRIGKNLNASGVRTIDGTGKHLTSGIIDEHSHIGISKGVNEGGQSVSAEVTIQDVVNPHDVNIYRQLAGGVTASQLLHGSANPIGGRSALIKLKYGTTADAMLIDGADGFIKFALGENVKQSNWGDKYNKRFPQTRMGVEQLMKDAFTRALEYRKAQAAFKKMSPWQQANTEAPAKDYELEYLLEILDGKRFVSCHSYVQSEINMLMKLAEEFGFRINTFTHILEGYKVADKMAAHGAAGSTFADWWAYKYEVKDAIPYNAALMHQNGVLTGINSDDAEMGRRLNQEAAKTVKYGGVSEEDAWKMVTLNPAKMLHLDDKMGSIKIGKDADLVLWSDSPLSVAAKPELTMIDGAVYFDRSKQDEKQEFVKTEKWRLYQLMQTAIKNGEKPSQPTPSKQGQYHCLSMEGAYHEH